MGVCGVGLALYTFVSVPVAVLHCVSVALLWLSWGQWPKNVTLNLCLAVVLGVVAYWQVCLLYENHLAVVQCPQYSLVEILAWALAVAAACYDCSGGNSSVDLGYKPGREGLRFLLACESCVAIALSSPHPISPLGAFTLLLVVSGCICGNNCSNRSSSVSTKHDPGSDESAAVGATAGRTEEEEA